MIYFDFFGTLTKYNTDDFTGLEPIYLQTDTSFITDVKPDPKAIGVISSLFAHNANNPSKAVDIGVITDLPNLGLQYTRHMDAILNWLNLHCNCTDWKNRLIAIPSDRQQINGLFLNKIAPYNILIDDYNPNLIAWLDAGGYAIKWCNDINSPNDTDDTSRISYPHLNLTLDMNITDITDTLYYVHELTQKGKKE